MKKSLFTNWKNLTVAFMAVSSLHAFAEEARFEFNPQETKEYAAFFKQPSALEGKCNAEVLGIDVNRPGFSWDDMNTWLNSEGKLWRKYNPAKEAYGETLFGVKVNNKPNDPFKGKTSGISWTTNDTDDKWYPAIENSKYLKGTFVMSDCWVTVVNIAGTQMDTIKIAMNNTDMDCYLNIRRNPVLRQIDLSNSKGKCRQLQGYSNMLSDENSLKCENIRKTEFLDWLLNIENNCYTFSTLPLHPAKGTKLGSGYKDQWKNRGGYPIGQKNADGEFEILVDEDIDLSSEYDVEGKITEYAWKDLDGNPVELANDNGFFCFGPEHVGKTYRCEMMNGNYSQLILKTVFVTVVNDYSQGSVEGVANDNAAIVCTDNVISVSTTEEVTGVQVYNFNGQCVKTVFGGQTQVSVADLAAGMYIVKVTTTEGNYTEKVIKK